MSKPNEPFRIGDYVTFHTQYGPSTGIIELITTGRAGRHQVAIITVRHLHGKPHRYHRPLYKLKHANLL